MHRGDTRRCEVGRGEGLCGGRGGAGRRLAGANQPALKTAVLMYKTVVEGEGKLGVKKRRERGVKLSST
jgi:hypothetical protein